MPLILVTASLMAAGGCDGPAPGDVTRPTQTAPARAMPDPPPIAIAAPTHSATPLPPSPPALARPDRPSIEIAGSDDSADDGPQVLASSSGAMLPLARILDIARARVKGEVIDVELDDDDGAPEYEITILTPDGRSIEMHIDARKGAIRKLEED